MMQAYALASLYVIAVLWLWGTAGLHIPALEDMVRRPCPVIVEQPGRGALCLTDDEARRLRLEAGDLWPEAETAPRQRMAPQRLLLAEVRLDINRATLGELIALPEIGEGLANAIVAARAQGLLRCQPDVAQIPGVGFKRLARIMPFLKSLPARCPKQNQE